MANRGLLFIPDISGFTRFVNEIEIDHSRMIIQELLEMLINANQLDLKISEIEGDAILFYRYGDAPPLHDLYRQVEAMFCNFHKHLSTYDHQRYCYCRACDAAASLTLKIVTHYGEFTGYRVQQFEKLIGRDIIVAHQLLKNNIQNHEYWLVTDNVVKGSKPSEIEQWMMWERTVHNTEGGEISFHYTQLAPLKTKIPPYEEPGELHAGEEIVIQLSREFSRSLITMFHAAGDFNQRHLWQEGVIRVEDVSHCLPRVGMKCRKVTDAGSRLVTATGCTFTEERVEFVEREENGTESMHYLLEQTGQFTSRFTWTCYTKAGTIARIQFNLFRKNQVLRFMQKSMDNLEKLAESLEELDVT